MTPLGEVRFDERGGIRLAHVDGEVDLSNVEHIGSAIRSVVENASVGLVVDLSGTDYLDSAAIRLLFDLARRLRRRGQELRVVVPPEAHIEAVLAMTELRQVAPLHPTVDEAVAAMARGAAADPAEEGKDEAAPP